MTKKTYPCLETLRVSDLKPSACQSRLHTSTSVELARRTLEQFGLLVPPVYNVTTGTLLTLRTVVEALPLLGVETVQVWCVQLDPEVEDAAALLLNSHFNDYDWEHVAVKLKRVVAAGLPLCLTGMAESDTGPLLAADWSPKAKAPLDDVHADTKQGGLF